MSFREIPGSRSGARVPPVVAAPAAARPSQLSRVSQTAVHVLPGSRAEPNLYERDTLLARSVTRLVAERNLEEAERVARTIVNRELREGALVCIHNHATHTPVAAPR